MNPRHPVYIVSKGRWQDNRRLTVKALEAMGVPFLIVVEAEQADQYIELSAPMPWLSSPRDT